MDTSLDTLNERYGALSARRALTGWLVARAITPLGESALDTARRTFGHNAHFSTIEKAATSAVGVGDAGLTALRPLVAPWANLIRGQTVLGRMVAATRRVPRHQAVTVVDTGAAAAFTTEGDPILVTRPTLTDASLSPGKIAGIIPYTREALKASSDRAAVLIERDLSRALALAEDVALLDGGAAVTGGRPASILEGLTALGAGSPPDLVEDVRLLLATVRGGEDAVALFFVTSFSGARYLLSARDATSDQRLFPDVVWNGGSIYGVPLLVSRGCPDSTLALVDGDALLVVDDDDVRFDIATAAAFQFDTAPSAGAANVISLWQTNSVGIKVERYVAWRKAWADGAAYIDLPLGSPA